MKKLLVGSHFHRLVVFNLDSTIDHYWRCTQLGAGISKGIVRFFIDSSALGAYWRIE